MPLFKCLIVVFSFSVFQVNASISLAFKVTEQGYWYAKAYNNDPLIPSDVLYRSGEDLCQIMSPAETICFLSGILRKDHPVLSKLNLYGYVKNKKLKIPEKDIFSLRSDSLLLSRSFVENNKLLFEKIRKFWGVTKNAHIYCFYSRLGEKQSYSSGFCLENFVHGNDVYVIILMCCPSLASQRMKLNKQLSVVAHEFSHAMCNAAYGQEKFETLISKIPSKNAIVVSWYLNEALAIVLGNGLVQETLSRKKVDLKKEEYCVRGFASALYEITKDYFDNSKTIDDVFLEKAVKIFDRVCPNGYMDPNICLKKVSVICPNFISERDLFFKLSEKIHISWFYYTNFSKLTDDEIKYTQTTNETIMVIFRDKKQLKVLNNLLPLFDDKAPISIIHKNKRTYVLIKIDDKHSLDDRINELFS
ncbi:MAG: hypothetical protein LBB21_04465 [Holosporaceae bacterium]|jgi:hypothetical protein|nr:hypothetical protein [Holosporaceae bacterium]